MAEEFHPAGLCGGGNYYWWNNTTPSAAVNMSDPTVVGSLGWPTSAADMEESGNMDMKLPQRKASSDVENSGGLLLDSTLQMLGFGVPSDWSQPNHSLRGGGVGGDCNYNKSMLQEEDTTCSISYQNHKDWNSPPKSFSSEEDDSSPSSFNNTRITNTSVFVPSAANSYANTNNSNYSCSSLFQTLFEPNHHPQQQQDASVFNNRCLSYSPSSVVTTTSLNEVSSPNSWQKLSPFLQHEPKQQPAVASSLHFSNNIDTPFWNSAPAPALSDSTVRSSFLPPQSQFVSPNLFATKTKAEQVRDSTSVARKGNTTTTSSSTDQPAFKRPRMETPSPLPTFKVRKEKLGDRITALQQLVSPFGKTDTASVLHEAIEYIKFLHDQVSVLSTPYMKNGAPLQHQQMQASSHAHHKVMKETEIGGEAEQDLRSRGLCLVPISSTFPVASETSPDFWTPTFGGTFR